MMTVRIHYTDGSHTDHVWDIAVARIADTDYTVTSGEFHISHVEILEVSR